MTDPQWVPFVGLTAVVLVLLLALARASQGTVRGDRTVPAGDVGREMVRRHALAEGELAHDPARECRADRATPQLTTGALLVNVAVTQGLFGGVLLAGAYFYAIPPGALGVTADPWNAGVPALLVGVAFGLALWGANEASASLADAVGTPYDEGLREALAPEGGRGWLVLLGGVLPVVAVVEEFIFRAAVVGVPAAGFGVSPWALAVVSASAFAVGHGAQGRIGMAVTGGLGLVLAAGYVLTGSLLVVVVAHYLVNALEFLVHEGFGVERLL
ncbi:MAG: CPBP family intramembrane metalloprotease [Halobacteriales archaeon SW_9_67_25]|nr:MAG: CPBP family intramembrane metalloprotease [Halobacteriales archaeon SW_9_67_25]